MKPYITGGIWLVSPRETLLSSYCVGSDLTSLQCSKRAWKSWLNNIESYTTLSGCEVNGTAENVVAGEESESAFLLDVFTTISAQLNSLLT